MSRPHLTRLVGSDREALEPFRFVRACERVCVYEFVSLISVGRGQFYAFVDRLPWFSFFFSCFLRPRSILEWWAIIPVMNVFMVAEGVAKRAKAWEKRTDKSRLIILGHGHFLFLFIFRLFQKVLQDTIQKKRLFLFFRARSCISRHGFKELFTFFFVFSPLPR